MQKSLPVLRTAKTLSQSEHNVEFLHVIPGGT